MKNDMKEILYSEEQIKEKIKELGEKISEDYKDKEPILICILKGGVMFMADLMKELKIYCTMDFMAVSSYGSATSSSGNVRILKDLDKTIEGKDVLIIEDIIDSGITLKYLLKNLKSRNPNSIKIACLLNKPSRREVDINVDYAGFEIPDKFVVGYGLDYIEKYRNLPYIGVLKESIYN